MSAPAPSPIRSRRGRWWLGSAAAILIVAVAIGVVHWTGTGRYHPVGRPCDLVDGSPPRTADPFATSRSRSATTHDDGTGAATGLRVGYCVTGYHLDARPGEAFSLVRVAFAVYPSARQSARAYLQSRRGDLRGDTGDTPLPTPRWDEPVTFTDAIGLGAPTAFCTARVTGPAALRPGTGFLVGVRDSNLLLEVYVKLSGQRMTQARHRWAAAAITRATLTALRSRTGAGS
ncbi:hypothetical protein Athai_00110 [Actinocatenispora thailandica]|uniref:Uncharacterized protein n=1 Tax=Actinocatenispora thailandica TaxID=227318 RepID=A0A7R7HUF2_9ACTN|nr:hypothetical protein [Actinocatenispora thailandica]BCJ32508.1 hypothetical protein Athai_00110 [Actinocatenispora thailandica]